MAHQRGLSLGEEEKRGLDLWLLWRLLRYARADWHLFALAGVLILVSTGMELAPPYIIKTAIDSYLLNPAADQAGLVRLAGIYMAITAGVLLTNYWQAYLLQLAGQRVIYRLRQAVFSHLQRLSLSFFDTRPVGQLVTRVANDTQALNQLYTEVLVTLFKDIFLLVGIVIAMLSLDRRLALLALIGVPLVTLSTALYRHLARKAYRGVRLHLARVNSFLQEHISAMRLIQAFGRERANYEQFTAVNRDYYQATMQELHVSAVFRPTMDLINSLIIALLLWYGGGRVIEGLVTFGVIYAMINYTQQFFRPINDMAEKYTILQAAMAAAEKVFGLLEEKPAVVDAPEVIVRPRWRGEIEFDRVWFAYQPPHWVLRDITLAARPGENLALVGPTGAGKTSIASLICRFYDVQRGAIRLDGVDIRQIPQALLRRQIGLVLQDVSLFSGTIAENLTLGNPDVGRDRIVRAIEAAQADFVWDLPGGLEAQVGERGVNLSQGQRQLLALARALVVDPPVLILDEATASVDTETEGLIQQALARAASGRTTIIIAHRLSTIQNASRILVVNHGEIVEQGTHGQLLAARGLYWRLWQLADQEEKILQSAGKGFGL